MKRLLCTLFCASLVAGSFGRAIGADQRAVLTLRVNTVPKQEVTVTLHDDDVLISRADLEAAGIHGLSKSAADDSPVSLTSLKPDITFRLDDVALTLDLTVSTKRLDSTVVDYRPRQDITIAKPVRSAFLNYAVATSNQSGATFSGEFGTQIGAGSFSSTMSFAASRDYRSNITRWIVDSPQSDKRLTIGDVVTTTGDLGGTVSIAGIGLQRYFGLNPDVIKTALPQVAGNALTPSTADVYVNGILYRHETLPPGQFNFQNLPVTQGPNNTTIVVTDAFGRTQTYSNYFYGADTLLAKGLSDFAYGFGALHSQFGEQTGHGVAASARYQAGLNDNVTGGGRIELSPAVVSGGPAFAFRLRNGVFNAEAAVSRATGGTGEAALLSYQYVTPNVTGGIALTMLSPRYATLALTPDQDRAMVNGSVTLAKQLGKTGGVSVSYLRQNDRDNGAQSGWQATQTLMLSHSTLLQVSENLTSIGGSKQFGVQTNLNFVPRPGLNAAVSTAETDGKLQTGIQLQHALGSETPAFGYTLSANGGQGNLSEYAAAQYRGEYGEYMAGFGTAGGETNLSANLSGALVLITGKMFATQSVSDSFALVDTGGMSGVRVLANNVIVGRTHKNGYFIVPRLGSYMNNDISIASSDLPLDYSLDGVTQRIAPPYRSGGVVHFGISLVRPVTGSLLVALGKGRVIPSYGVLELNANGKMLNSDIGEDGEFYFEKLSPGTYPATIRFDRGSCTFDLTIPTSADKFLKLGTLLCNKGLSS